MKRIWLAFLILGFVFEAQAQLTLEDCHRMARENYPGIRQYDLIRRSTEYTVSNAVRAWLPQLTLSAQATWQTDVPGFPEQMTDMFAAQGLEIPGLRQDQYKIQLELYQNIWDGGKSKADRLAAAAEDAVLQRSADADMYALRARVDNLYFGILLLEDRLARTELTLELLQSNLEKVRSLLQNGVAMPHDVDALEAEWLSAGQQKVQIEASLDSYRRMLSVFVGQDIAGVRLLRPELVLPVSAESARPELAVFDARIAKLSAQERSVKSASNPRFGLFAQGYYGYPGMDYFSNMMNSDWSFNALVGIRMSWNFSGYYTRGNHLNQLRLSRQQVEVQRDVFLFNNRMEAAEENGRIASLRKALADDDRIVELRRSVREAAESKLRNGIIDMNDLLQKITDEAAAITARSTHEIELLKAIYELKHTINQ